MQQGELASPENWAAVEYLEKFCSDIQLLDQKIRFTGIADYGGKLQASIYRRDLSPLMTKEETKQYALQTVFRARTRGGFKSKIGEQRYAVSVYDRLIRSTIVISHPDEYRSLYFLISLDIDCDYPAIIEKKVLPNILRNRPILFEKTSKMSAKYAV